MIGFSTISRSVSGKLVMSNAKMAVAAYAGEKAGAYYYHYDFV